jgi:ankyrin repeat protein
MKQMVANLFRPWKKRELYDLCNTAREDDEEALHSLRQWLSRNKNHTRRFKEAAGYLDEWDNTPLHWILLHQPPPDVVELLIQYAPGTLRLKNSIGWLPLQFACLHGASLEVLNLLIQAYPESTDIPGTTIGDKPSQLLKEWAHHKGDNEHVFLLHKATSRGLSLQLVKLLLETFPESALTRDRHGMAPLHYACSKNSVHSLDIVMLLLHACPESYSLADRYGRTPSCLLKKAASQRDDNGMLLLHRHAANSTDFDVNSFNLLFHAYPDSILIPDSRGMLPFHHVCLNEASSVDTLMSFLMLFPESIVTSGS